MPILHQVDLVPVIRLTAVSWIRKVSLLTQMHLIYSRWLARYDTTYNQSSLSCTTAEFCLHASRTLHRRFISAYRSLLELVASLNLPKQTSFEDASQSFRLLVLIFHLKLDVQDTVHCHINDPGWTRYGASSVERQRVNSIDLHCLHKLLPIRTFPGSYELVFLLLRRLSVLIVPAVITISY